MMCSKKCANPVFPGSTSFRDPVCTGIWIETMFGNPVGTTMTLSPLGSVFSTAEKGRTSDDADLLELFFVAVPPARGAAWIVMRVSRIRAGARNRDIG